MIPTTTTAPSQKADIDDKVIVCVWSQGLKRIGSVVDVQERNEHGGVQFYYKVRIWGGRAAMTDKMRASTENDRTDECWFNDNEIELSDAYLHRVKRRA